VQPQRTPAIHTASDASIRLKYLGIKSRRVPQWCPFEVKHAHSSGSCFSMKVIALLTLSANAGPCAQDIDRAWIQVGPKIQARIGAGRSAQQAAIALLHRQPTPKSIAIAQVKLGEVWKPMEMAVAALGRAREAEHAHDAPACEQAVFEAQREILP
jgi:hypothetical protein